MLVFEFTVAGPPLSYQTRNRRRLEEWRHLVRTAAAIRWGGVLPWTDALRIIVTYYHDGPAVRMDNDNMIKPIQDALIGLVYEDDRQITDTTVRKTGIDGAFQVRRASSILLEAFARGDEFLHIRIESAPDHSSLLS